MSNNILYRHLWLYRTVMQILYRGRYTDRACLVCQQLRETDRKVLELCFADTLIANHCRRQVIAWTGLDQSAEFVARARRRGFDARPADLRQPPPLPACDVCIMMGSLYQFNGSLEDLFSRIKASSGRFILLEPVKNWTHTRGLLRSLAIRLTRMEPHTEPFRFTSYSLVQTLNRLREAIGFEFRVAQATRDMLVEVTWLK